MQSKEQCESIQCRNRKTHVLNILELNNCVNLSIVKPRNVISASKSLTVNKYKYYHKIP